MVKKITALEARRHLGEILNGVYDKSEQYVIERAGRPVAAVVPIRQLAEQEQRRDQFFSMIDEVRRRNRRVKPQIIEREVAAAVRAVRTKAVRRGA